MQNIEPVNHSFGLSRDVHRESGLETPCRNTFQMHQKYVQDNPVTHVCVEYICLFSQQEIVERTRKFESDVVESRFLI